MAATVNELKRLKDRSPEKLDAGVGQYVGVGYTAQTNCIDLDGSTEHFRVSTKTYIGHGNEWTFMLWFNKTTDFSANSAFFQFDGSGGANKIYMNISSSTQGRLDITVKDSANVDQHWMRNDSYFSTGSGWHLLTVTHTNTLTQVYRDNSATHSDTSPSITMDDTDLRGLYNFGSKFNGRVHSMAMWTGVLDSDNRGAIYNSGDSDVDLNEDAGNYDQSANLIHWWRIGHDDSADANLGLDYATSPASVMDLMQSASNITTADVVVDAP